MTAKTFGKRSLVPTAASPARSMSMPPGVPAPADQPATGPLAERDLLAFVPLLTFGLILFLMLVFGAQHRFAFDVDADGNFSHESLLAFGAASYDLVVGSGEVWRVFLAPLLHGSGSHLIGNLVALFFVGWRLEPMIGRSWLGLIFVASALGGEIGSLAGNPHDIVGVGASGAISGLIGALFTQSFHWNVPPEERVPMFRTSLFFGVPALLPLLFAHSGNTDYFAHAGGALTGAVLAFAIGELDSADPLLPVLARKAFFAALAGLGISLLSCGFAAAQYRSHAAVASLLIPSAEMPGGLQADAKKSVQLAARYPKDPNSHIIRAVYLVDNESPKAAEAELRLALDLASPGPVGRNTRKIAQFILALVLHHDKREREAIDMAADYCKAGDSDPMRKALDKVRLCRPGNARL